MADLTTATDAANKQKKCGAGTACGWSLGAVIVLLITTSVLALVGYCAKKVAHEESSKELAVIEKELVEKNSLISQHGAGALSKELEEIKKELADTKEELAQKTKGKDELAAFTKDTLNTVQAKYMVALSHNKAQIEKLTEENKALRKAAEAAGLPPIAGFSQESESVDASKRMESVHV